MGWIGTYYGMKHVGHLYRDSAALQSWQTGIEQWGRVGGGYSEYGRDMAVGILAVGIRMSVG